MGIPQIASFRMKLGTTEPTTKSLDITGRADVMVDRIQAFITVQPSAAGALPTRDAVRMIERAVRLRLALDRQDAQVITVGDMPAAIFSQLDQGPVAVPPFKLVGNNQPTVKLDINANVFQTDVLKNYGDVELEIVFWGQGA
ncbi:hypothetical protein [Geothrix campi]|uniref:hypothetical protein n=1 Tax=Geothrix campi TaxID=2966450 RepID=UPI002147F5D8|nr:hypothetical protein [Geothrix sp. SG10]